MAVMPKITMVMFRRRFNLGNYETMDIEMVATVGENEKAETVLKALDDATVKYRKGREA